MVCLPESFAYLSSNSFSEGREKITGFDERIGGRLFDRYRQLALDNQVWLSLGSFPENSSTVRGKSYSTHVIVNEEGQIAASYRKLHMFDANMSRFGGVTSAESNTTSPGLSICEPCFSPVGYLGLSVSYDLRFPELYRHLMLKGAQILLVPSTFLSKTGAAHWETLLRTRAIEN